MLSLLLVRLADELVAFFPFGALESIRTDLSLTYGRASLLLVLYPVVGLLGSAGAVACDYVSRRLLATLGACGYGAGFLVMALGPSFAFLVAGICLAGIAGTVMVSAAEVALHDLAADEDELRALLGQQNVLAVAGDIGGPLLLSATLALGLGWRVAFAVAALALFAYGAFLAAQPLPAPAPVADADDAPSLWSGLRGVIGDRRVWALGLLLLLLTPFDEPFLGFAIAFLDEDRGHSAATATLVVGASTLGGLAGAGLAAPVGRRLGRRTAAGGAAVLAAGVLLVTVAPWPALQALAAAAGGAGLYLVWIDLQAQTLTLRPGQAGTTSSVVDVISQVGATAPLAIGHVADRAGLPTAMAGFSLLAVLLVLVAAATRQTAQTAAVALRRPQPRGLREQ